MIPDPEGLILAAFAAFCRIGGCFLVLPGFSSARVPQMVRLLIAIGVSFAILPLMWNDIYPKSRLAGSAYVSMVFIETAIGVVLGLITRYYILGLQFAGTVISMMIGFNAPPAGDVLEDSAESQITNLLGFAALLVLFMLDFHHQVIVAIVDTYKVMPPGAGFDPQKALITLTDTLSATFLIMLRLSSPFIIYSLLFNVAIGFINKLAPQMPIYFISTPYLLAGGLFLLFLGIAAMLSLFGDAFRTIFTG